MESSNTSPENKPAEMSTAQEEARVRKLAAEFKLKAKQLSHNELARQFTDMFQTLVITRAQLDYYIKKVSEITLKLNTAEQNLENTKQELSKYEKNV